MFSLNQLGEQGEDPSAWHRERPWLCWVKKEKQEKATFCLSYKKKPKPCSPPFVGAQLRSGFAGGISSWGRRMRPGAATWQWIYNHSFLVILGFFLTSSNSVGGTQAPGSLAGLCRVRDRQDTGPSAGTSGIV